MTWSDYIESYRHYWEPRATADIRSHLLMLERYSQTHGTYELPGTITPAKQIEILESILQERGATA